MFPVFTAYRVIPVADVDRVPHELGDLEQVQDKTVMHPDEMRRGQSPLQLAQSMRHRDFRPVSRVDVAITTRGLHVEDIGVR